MVRGPDADRAQSRQAAPVLPARVPPRFRLGDSCLRSRLRRSGTAARRRAPRLDGLSTNARVYFRGHLAAAGASTPESVAGRSEGPRIGDSLSRPFVSKPSRPHEPDPYRDDPGPTPETRAKLQPDPIRALLEAGVIDGPQAGAAEEIRDIIEALVGRAYGPAMREVPRPRAPEGQRPNPPSARQPAAVAPRGLCRALHPVGRRHSPAPTSRRSSRSRSSMASRSRISTDITGGRRGRRSVR